MANLLVLIGGGIDWLDSGSWAGDKKADDAKPALALPKDPKAEVSVTTRAPAAR